MLRYRLPLDGSALSDAPRSAAGVGSRSVGSRSIGSRTIGRRSNRTPGTRRSAGTAGCARNDHGGAIRVMAIYPEHAEPFLATRAVLVHTVIGHPTQVSPARALPFPIESDRLAQVERSSCGPEKEEIGRGDSDNDQQQSTDADRPATVLIDPSKDWHCRRDLLLSGDRRLIGNRQTYDPRAPRTSR